MQRPAIHQLLIKTRSGARAVVLDGSRNTLGHRADRERSIGFDRVPDECDLLFARDIDRHVGEAALYLKPLVAHLARQPVRVVIKRLMQNANDDEPAMASGFGFGELLEEIDVRIAGRRMFEELAHLIDDHDEPGT